MTGSKRPLSAVKGLSVNAFIGPTKLQGLLFMCQIVNSINVIKGGGIVKGKR